MNRILRSFILPSLAVVGVLVALPTIASADERHPTQSERTRFEHDRVERARFERERIERERFERERIARIEHERAREAREHQVMCERTAAAGAPRWRLHELGCFVR